MVLFLDRVGCRNFWTGLANRGLGLSEARALPHLDLTNAGDQQVALVHVITNGDGELFQPVRAGALGNLEEAADKLVPACTKLERLPKATAATYYLISRSRTDLAQDRGDRASHRKTRFGILHDHPDRT